MTLVSLKIKKMLPCEPQPQISPQKKRSPTSILSFLHRTSSLPSSMAYPSVDQKCNKAGGYWSVYDFNDPNTSKLLKNIDEIKQKPTVMCPCCQHKDVRILHEERPAGADNDEVGPLFEVRNRSPRLF